MCSYADRPTAGYKVGDKWRKVRHIHTHWYMLMESGALCHIDGRPMHLLSEWTDKDPFKRWAKEKGQRVSSHFKCFPHSALRHCFDSSAGEVLVHKHCLHAFNFVVKARYDDLVALTGYVAGPQPDDFGSVYAKKDLESALVFNPLSPELYIRRREVLTRMHNAGGVGMEASSAMSALANSAAMLLAGVSARVGGGYLGGGTSTVSGTASSPFRRLIPRAAFSVARLP
jgi:hypothetical protein